MIPFITSLLPTVNNIIDRIIPDKTAAAKAQAELAAMAMKGELDQVAGQLQINAAEAKSPHLFVAGWRPFIGWGGGVVLFLPYLVWAINTIVRTFGFDVPEVTMDDMPDGSQIMPIVLGMLGVTGARTWERLKGVERNNLEKAD